MKNLKQMGIADIKSEIGSRLRRERLNQNITQKKLSDLARISRRTLVAAEKGEGTTLETLIRLLRALGRLEQINQFLPEPSVSPIQVAKLKGKIRQKASKEYTYPMIKETAWEWGEK